MWDEDDHFGRWFQGFCALPLLLFFLFELYVLYTSPALGVAIIFRGGALGGSGYLAYRCLKYAVTGRDNINRDDF